MRVLVNWAEPDAAAKILAARGHDVVRGEGDGGPFAMALLDARGTDAPARCRGLNASAAVVLALLPRPDAPRAAAFRDAGAFDVLEGPLDAAALEARIRAAEMLAEAREARKKAEEEAAMAADRFQLLTEASFEGIAVHSEGRILYANEAFAKVLGATVDEVVGANALDFAAPEDRPRILASITSGFDQPYRARGLRKDGTTVPVEIRGRTIARGTTILRISAFRDLSAEAASEAERRQTEEALARSEARFRLLIEQAPDAVTVIGRDGKFLFANRKAAALLRIPDPDTLLGRSPSEFLGEESRARFALRTRALFEGAERSMPSEYEFDVPGCPRTTVEVVSLPIEFEGSKALLAFVRDVTERRQMEAQLRQSERLASLGLLAAGMAHEINNPLAFVAANLEFAAARAEGGSDLARALKEARDGAARVARIVRDLKAYARPGEEPPAPVDVREPLRFALAVTAAELRPRARIVEELGDVPRILGNEGRLGQVFVNLLTNAAHAIDEGAAEANRVRVSTRSENGRVVVEVEDTGRGIPAAHLPRLFEPFFTTKPPGRGTGLGLFVCHGIVQSLGGEIRVESEPGKGTKVRVSLPSTAAPAAAAAPRAPACALRGRRILVVDDEPQIGTTIARLLEPDHAVTAETRAEVALARLRAGERFDLILCDLMMPRMSGMDLHAEVSRTIPQQAAHMVFLTGGAFTPRSQEFLDTVGLPCLEKPFALEDLLRALASVP